MFAQYIPNDNEEIKNQLRKIIGVHRTEDLFSDLPKEAISNDPLRLPKSLSELVSETQNRKSIGKKPHN